MKLHAKYKGQWHLIAAFKGSEVHLNQWGAVSYLNILRGCKVVSLSEIKEIEYR